MVNFLALLCIAAGFIASDAMSISAQISNSQYCEMMKWYDKHNIISSKLSIRHGPNGRGVFVDADAFPFQGIAVIPPSMIIRPVFLDLEGMLEVMDV